jgi:hypothetical protein
LKIYIAAYIKFYKAVLILMYLNLSYTESTIVGIRTLKRKKNKEEKGEIRRGVIIGGGGGEGKKQVRRAEGGRKLHGLEKKEDEEVEEQG